MAALTRIIKLFGVGFAHAYMRVVAIDTCKIEFWIVFLYIGIGLFETFTHLKPFGVACHHKFPILLGWHVYFEYVG